MRSGRKQHYSWKLDDERRQRLTTSSGQTFPITTYNHRPGNYTHEENHTGIHKLGYNTDVDFIKEPRKKNPTKYIDLA
ncbi:unnamed protein product [Rotaria sp. Silwood1]|nr:unnamed protein product [Rotaria sp. Silwood1]